MSKMDVRVFHLPFLRWGSLFSSDHMSGVIYFLFIENERVECYKRYKIHETHPFPPLRRERQLFS